MQPKKPAPKKKTKSSTAPLSVHLHTLAQVLKNTKSTNDAECKKAVWLWLSNHDMYQFFYNDSRKKTADHIFNEVFMQVSAFCMKNGFCKKRPLTLPKFKQTWTKAIKKFENETKQPPPLTLF